MSTCTYVVSCENETMSDKKTCEQHLVQRNAIMKRWHDKHRAAGLCVRCLEPAVQGFGQCEKHRAITPATKAIQHQQKMQRMYGIDYESLLATQGEVCAICGCTEEKVRPQRLSVDHDHTTGRVRGLLCNKCNRAIGLLRDDAECLRRAADYLEGVKS